MLIPPAITTGTFALAVPTPRDWIDAVVLASTMPIPWRRPRGRRPGSRAGPAGSDGAQRSDAPDAPARPRAPAPAGSGTGVVLCRIRRPRAQNYGPTASAKVPALAGTFELGHAMSIRSPTPKATLPIPEAECCPLGIVQVNVVSAPFLRRVNVKSALGGVMMKQVRPVKVPPTAITCCTLASF